MVLGTTLGLVDAALIFGLVRLAIPPSVLNLIRLSRLSTSADENGTAG